VRGAGENQVPVKKDEEKQLGQKPAGDGLAACGGETKGKRKSVQKGFFDKKDQIAQGKGLLLAFFRGFGYISREK
jgi:hypothetical protein